MIRVEDLTLHAGTRVLLSQLNFALEPGQFVALLGANGSGKSTLLRALSGNANAHGSISFDGVALEAMDTVKRARLVAHIGSEEHVLESMSVREVVELGRYAHHRWWEWQSSARDGLAVEAALCACGVRAFSNRRFETLSSGERQRVWIALALAQESPVLLLDEPTSHLDLRASQEILALLRRQSRAGKTVLCALHDINEAAQYGDRILLIGEAGLLAFGEIAQVLTPALMERAYGLRMEAVATERGWRVFPSPLLDGFGDAPSVNVIG